MPPPPDDDDEPWAEEYELRCAAELGALLDAADAQLFGEAPAEQPATESGAESRRWAGAAAVCARARDYCVCTRRRAWQWVVRCVPEPHSHP